jgi:hypothetical protein
MRLGCGQGGIAGHGLIATSQSECQCLIGVFRR